MLYKKREFDQIIAENLKAIRNGAAGILSGGVVCCAGCNQPVLEAVTGMHDVVGAGCMCSDCYYAELGKLIEERPAGIWRKSEGA